MRRAHGEFTYVLVRGGESDREQEGVVAVELVCVDSEQVVVGALQQRLLEFAL